MLNASQQHMLAGGHRRAYSRAFKPAFPTRSIRSTTLASAVAVDAPSTSAPASSAHADPPAYRAHLDFKFVKENVDLVATNCKNRFSNADPHKVVALYDEFVALKAQVDALRAERNENANSMKVRPNTSEGHGYVLEGRSTGPRGHCLASRGDAGGSGRGVPYLVVERTRGSSPPAPPLLQHQPTKIEA